MHVLSVDDDPVNQASALRHPCLTESLVRAATAQVLPYASPSCHNARRRLQMVVQNFLGDKFKVRSAWWWREQAAGALA